MAFTRDYVNYIMKSIKLSLPIGLFCGIGFSDVIKLKNSLNFNSNEYEVFYHNFSTQHVDSSIESHTPNCLL